MGFFSGDGNTHGSGDAMVLYYGATKNPGHIRAALSHIESEEYLKGIGIEEESYHPQTLYRYGEKDAAYRIIMDLTRQDKDRRDYPEVSFSVIGAIVTGMMGIEVVDDGNRNRPLIHSISRLRSASDRAKIERCSRPRQSGRPGTCGRSKKHTNQSLKGANILAGHFSGQSPDLASKRASCSLNNFFRRIACPR